MTMPRDAVGRESLFTDTRASLPLPGPLLPVPQGIEGPANLGEAIPEQPCMRRGTDATNQLLLRPQHELLAGRVVLTERHDGPGEVETDVVYPEIEELGAAIGHALKPVGRVVERHAVQVGDAHDHLQGVTDRGAAENGGQGEEGERAPGELSTSGCQRRVSLEKEAAPGTRTTVIVSTQTVKTSRVR
jgi:hypothetical protein